MTKVVLLDTGSLGQVTHPRIKPKIREWLRFLQINSIALRVPEIADYELRRELLRSGKEESVERLNKLEEYCFIPLTPATMRKAADLWAWVRNQGQPTASKDSLDGDVLLVAQAILQIENFNEVVIATTNSNHIARFLYKGISVLDWQQSLDNMSFDPAKLTLSQLVEELEQLGLPEGEELNLSTQKIKEIKKGEKPDDVQLIRLSIDFYNCFNKLEIELEDLEAIRRSDFGE